MISKLQFNLKFNHPSNIFFLQLGSNFLSTILTENSIVKLAVRLHIIFWSKPLHRLFQIYYCICVYLVLYLYFQVRFLFFRNCTWQLALWRCTLMCWSCVSNQAAASAAPNLLLSSSCCNTIYRKFAKRQIRKRPTQIKYWRNFPLPLDIIIMISGDLLVLSWKFKHNEEKGLIWAIIFHH